VMLEYLDQLRVRQGLYQDGLIVIVCTLPAPSSAPGSLRP
jgi:hypothetical protein